MTVLPQPNAPGMAVVPPCCSQGPPHQHGAKTQWPNSGRTTAGKSVSSTRWPVSSGKSVTSFSVTGRGARTGQSCIMVCCVVFPSNSVSQTMSCRGACQCSTRNSSRGQRLAYLDGVGALLGEESDSAHLARGDHDLVALDQAVLDDRAEDVSRTEVVSDLASGGSSASATPITSPRRARPHLEVRRGKVPLLRPVQRLGIDPSGDVDAVRLFLDRLERALDAAAVRAPPCVSWTAHASVDAHETHS